ncbi:MAG TPA: hypothetical protein DEA08_04110 [Planctomycetes bacterium]|nr:hypothetical protein [Planctomycetota bacterium]
MSEIESSPTMSIQSDSGMIVVYDPAPLKERVKAASTWWKDDPFGIAERQDGRVALWPLSTGKATSRSYRVRVGDSLAENEVDYVVEQRADPTPLVVEGNEVFLGPVERLPGDGGGDRLSAIPDGGQLFYGLPPGRYAATACVLDWQRHDHFFNDDNEPTADAPPDVVILVEATDELPSAPPEPTPLLELIPKKAATAKAAVTFIKKERRVIELDKAPGAKKKRKSSSTSRSSSRGRGPSKVKVTELRPGEMGIGATVRHPTYGVGTVLFVKNDPQFTKAKVKFQGEERKVEKDELTVLS